jgi:hypothetical protein
MVRGYYEVRQWDERGFVPEWKRVELGLGELDRGTEDQRAGVLS